MAHEKLNEKGILQAYTPRWIVFVLDMLLVGVSYSAVVLVFSLLAGSIRTGVAERMLTTVLIYAFFELVLNIYKGTVRYSGMGEIVRLFLYCFCCIATTISAYTILASFSDIFTVSPLWVIFHGVISFILMFSFRVSVRYAYYFLSVANNKRKRVLMYGVDPNTIAMAQLFASDISSEYKPVAFLDVYRTSKNMRIGVMQVEKKPDSVSGLKDLMDSLDTESLVFTAERLDGLTHAQIDEILNAGIKLMKIGSTSDINSAKTTAKISVNDIKIEDLLNRDVIKTENSIVAEKHRDKVVLVTGAAGSIGSEVVLQIAEFRPKLLILMDQAESPLYDMEMKIKSEFKDLNYLIFIGDVRNEQRMVELFDTHRPDVIYHAAAYKHVPMMERYPAEAIRVNVKGTKMLADLAVKYNARKFVMVSTDKAVNPTNVMGASKRIAEIYVQSLYLNNRSHTDSNVKTTRFITTRFGNVLGSNGSVVPLFKNQISKGGPVTVTHKDIIRYFMTIPEACRLVLEAGCMGKGGEIFVFDMGEPVKIYDLAKRMIRLSGLEPGKDINIVETGLRPGEKLFEELLNDKEITLPTHNRKIMVAKVREYDYQLVNDKVCDLVAAAIEGNNEETVRRMKRIVPEFKSKNSIYEKLDKEFEGLEPELNETHEGKVIKLLA